MPIIFIDNRRKYKFLIGYVIKLGKNFYRIAGIEDLRHKEATGSVAALTVTTKDWDTYLKPLDGYMYFVEFIGIDGLLGFLFEFPKGTPHGTPRGNIEYIYFDEASILDPMYLPFLVITPHHPSFRLYNPTAAANNSDVIFKGEKWQVDKLSVEEAAALSRNEYTEMTNYAKTRGLGQG